MPVGSNTNITNTTIGYAAADLPHNGRELYVHCPQLTPFAQGELNAIEASNDVNTTGGVSGASSYHGSVKATNFIKCQWKGDPDQPYPPAIRKGEQVTVFSIGDSDMWYWSCDGRDENLRRLDTKRISVSGNLDNNSDNTDDNTYFIELDTLRHKHIKLSTSQADGEKYRYMLLLDAGNNFITLTDDRNNAITIESSDAPRITLKNSKNTFVVLDNESITLACKKDINIKSEEGKVMLQSKGNISMTSTDGRATIHSKGMARMTAQSGPVHIGSRNDEVIIETPEVMTLNVGHLAISRYSGPRIDWGNDYV